MIFLYQARADRDGRNHGQCHAQCTGHCADENTFVSGEDCFDIDARELMRSDYGRLISLPKVYIRPMFKSLVDIFRSSSSWRVRQRASTMIPAIFLRYLETWSATDDVPRILEVMLASLEDENVEVRTNASVNLALVIRSSMQEKIAMLQV